MKKKLLLSIILSSLVVIASILSIIRFTYAGTKGFNDVEISNTYEYGDTFTVPDNKYTDGSKEFDTYYSLIKPSGNAYSNKNVLLDEVGAYQLIYYSNVYGEIKNKVYAFIVDYDSLSYSNKTTVSYGIHKYAMSNDPETMSNGGGYVAHDTEGILVSLAKSDTLVFNKLIDITDLTKNDTLINGFITPESRGTNDFTGINLIFTDSEDDSIFFRVNFYHYPDAGTSYARANGNNQPLSGWNYYDNGGSGALHQQDTFGTSSRVSFTGVVNGVAHAADATDGLFDVKYDKATQSIYHKEFRVIDLDEPIYFTRLWSGFKSNKVRLSITCDGYQAETASFCISEIFGYSKDDLRDLVTNKFRDTEGPKITLKVNEYDLPNALKGGKYPIPEAVAFDEYSKDCDVSVKVYHNYQTKEETRVDIVNGYFETKEVGSYAIEYSSTDKFGNTSKKIVMISSSTTKTDINFTVDGAIPSALSTGMRISLPDIKDVSGGSGEKYISTLYRLNGTETEIDRFFKPLESGNYDLIFRVTDYVGQVKDIVYPIVVTTVDKFILKDSPVLDKYYIEKSNYTLPTLKAYNYLTNTEADVVIRITDGAGTKTYNSGSVYNPTSSDTGIVTFEYLYNNEVLETLESNLVNIFSEEIITVGGIEIKTQKMSLENFFISSGIDFETSNNSFFVKLNASKAALEFITPQFRENLSTVLREFTIGYGSSIKVILTDSLNSNISTYLNITKTEFGISLSTDKETITLPTKMESNSEFEIKFNNNTFNLNGENISVLEKEFLSDKVFISYEVDGKQNNKFNLKQINGFTFTNAVSDKTGPKISITGSYGGVFELNDTYDIVKTVSADVLFPYLKSFTLTVTSPDGTIKEDVNGLLLDKVDPTIARQIILDMHGSYKIEIVSIDEKDNESKISYLINVIDQVKPTITLKSGLKDTYKIDELIILPAVEISDNITAKEDLVLIKYMYNPNGKLVQISNDSTAFRTNYTGEYEFIIYVIDKAGNIETRTLSFTVTE